MGPFFHSFFLILSGKGRGYIKMKEKIEMCYLEWYHFYKKKCKKKKKKYKAAHMGNLAYLYGSFFFFFFMFSSLVREGGYIMLKDKIQMCYLEWLHFYIQEQRWALNNPSAEDCV